MAEFKPNIYPIMYWGLLYGLVGGFVLILILFLSTYITLLWFPFFLACVIWGGYRNYEKQKRGAGVSPAGSAIEELKSATSDIVNATREMIRDQQAEDNYEEGPITAPTREREMNAAEEIQAEAEVMPEAASREEDQENPLSPPGQSQPPA